MFAALGLALVLSTSGHAASSHQWVTPTVQAPRTSSKQVDELMREVYGGKQEHFRTVSPRRYATDNAAVIARHSLVRLVIGSGDNTFDNNLDTHDWVVVEGIGHDPLGLLRAMGDRHWAFYREAFKPF